MKNFTILALILLTNPLCASRPLKSNDAFTLGRNLFQLEIAADLIGDESNFITAFPLALTFGLVDKTDIIVSTNVVNNRSSNALITFECLDFGIKQNLFESDFYNGAIATGFSSSIENKKLNSPTAFISIINSFVIENLVIHYNLGYNQNFADEEFKDLWFTSLGVEYTAAEKIKLGLDAGIGRDPSVHCPIVQSYTMVGIAYSLMENLIIDTGISFTFQHNTRVELMTIGFTYAL